MVGDLGPGGEGELFGIGVRPRAPGRDLHGLDAGTGQDCVERFGELVGAENLCDQVLFVEDAASAVAPHPEMIQISNAVGQGAERCGLFQGSEPEMLLEAGQLAARTRAERLR